MTRIKTVAVIEVTGDGARNGRAVVIILANNSSIFHSWKIIYSQNHLDLISDYIYIGGRGQG